MGKRPIFGPATWLFVGYSPTPGIVLPDGHYSSRVGFPSLPIQLPTGTTCRSAASNVANPNLWPCHPR